MKLSVLGSGSRGNCTWLSTGSDAILIDAGFGIDEFERRIAALELDPSLLRAIIITHEHRDHCGGAKRISRKWEIPIYMPQQSSRRVRKIMGKNDYQFFDPLIPFEVAGLNITAFDVPHDAPATVGFRIEHEGKAVGFVTDVGHPHPDVIAAIKGVDLLCLEFNHELEMLLNGPYNDWLKSRVSGARGHVSNEQAAEILQAVHHADLQAVVLLHLSAENNSPEIAEVYANEVVKGSDTAVIVSKQDEPMELRQI